jgi:ubiquinone/menaquinone biosynthesis C-methylase UbiE
VPDDAALQEILKEISRVLRPGGTALLHQKISVRLRQRLLPSLRHAVKMIVRPKRGRTKDGAQTRGVDEIRFVEMCALAGLRLRYVAAITPIAAMTSQPRLSAFYALEKM